VLNYSQAGVLPAALSKGAYRNMSKEKSDYHRMIKLIHRIAREEAWQVMDEHLSNYEHQEKSPEEA